LAGVAVTPIDPFAPLSAFTRGQVHAERRIFGHQRERPKRKTVKIE
jgi:hypothetical protein